MAEQGTILVGTVGQGVMCSRDGGETWQRGSIGQGLHSDAIVRTVQPDPARPDVVYAGTDKGLYCSEDAGMSWRLLDTAMNDQTVWVLSFDPTDSNVRYAGTGTPQQAGLFKSTDAGETWQRQNMEIAEWCPAVGVPRFTGISVDPTNPRSIWAGLEVDGLRHSADGGQTWSKVNGQQLPNPDVHSVLVVAGPPKTIFNVVNNDVWVSSDDGASWEALNSRAPLPYRYPRCIAVKPNDPKTVYLTLGDATPGRIGTVMRSKDAGQSWESLDLSTPPNSAMWTVSMHPSNPEQVFAGSRYGYLYRSADGGDTWTKLWRELSEVSSIAWIPS